MEDTNVASKDFGDNGKGKSAAKRMSLEQGENAPFRGYINLNLSADEKAAYQAWATPDVVFGTFERAVVGGVNVSVKIDPRGAGVLASATQRRSSSVNAGLCVTARAGDAVTAFGRLMYLLNILERAESWEATQPMAEPDRW